MSCCKPTFQTASSSRELVCLCVCMSVCVFSRGEGFSEDPYSGRLMPQAHEHICLSMPTEASCVFQCVCARVFSCM